MALGSWSFAAFRHHGKMLVAFGATENHCAFYLMSSTIVETHKDERTNFETTKGTIHFHPDKPPPAALVRKLVMARIAENEVQRGITKERVSCCSAVPPSEGGRHRGRRSPR